MGRLTAYCGEVYVPRKLNLDFDVVMDMPQEEWKHFQDIFKKLAHYEDLEEQGLLPRFHLSEEFWTFYLDRVEKAKVVMLQQKKDGSWKYRLSREITKEYHSTIDYEEREYGEYFFNTKEEAKAKLEELKGGGTDG